MATTMPFSDTSLFLFRALPFSILHISAPAHFGGMHDPSAALTIQATELCTNACPPARPSNISDQHTCLFSPLPLCCPARLSSELAATRGHGCPTSGTSGNLRDAPPPPLVGGVGSASMPGVPHTRLAVPHANPRDVAYLCVRLSAVCPVACTVCMSTHSPSTQARPVLYASCMPASARPVLYASCMPASGRPVLYAQPPRTNFRDAAALLSEIR